MDKPAEHYALHLDEIAGWVEDAGDKTTCRDAARLLREQAAALAEAQARADILDQQAHARTDDAAELAVQLDAAKAEIERLRAAWERHRGEVRVLPPHDECPLWQEDGQAT